MSAALIVALFLILQGRNPEPGFILEDGRWLAVDRHTAFSLPDGWISTGTASDPLFVREAPPGQLRIAASCTIFDLDRMSYEEVFGPIETEDANIERERIDIGSRRGVRERQFEQSLQIADTLRVETGSPGPDCTVHFSFTEPEGATGAADMVLESLDLDAGRPSYLLFFVIAFFLWMWLSWNWYVKPIGTVKTRPTSTNSESTEEPDVP